MVLKGPLAQAREDGLSAANEGRFTDAVPLLERAASAPPTDTVDEKRVAATVENALGGALKALGRRDEAAGAFDRAIMLLGRVSIVDDEDIELQRAVVVNNLGAARADAGRAAEAEALYHRALRIFGLRAMNAANAADDDDDDADVRSAEVLNNLADLRHDARRLEEARWLHERALHIRERELGKDHLALAGSLNNVAVLLMDQQKHTEALPILRRAAKITRKKAGKEHPQHATALSNLANALTQLGRPLEAKPHLKRALSISKSALGPEHESTTAAAESLKACEAAIVGHAQRPVQAR